MLDLFVTPLVSVLVAGFFSMTLIGPVFAQIESWVLSGVQALIAIPFGIGAFIMGGVYAPTVVAGVHHMYNAIEMMMLADNGMNTWMPIATAANVAQGAAALAVALKTKNKKTKAMALPASLSAFLGITEPAIFGVNVRFMRPFIAGMIGGACGGALASIMHVYATANGVTGIFGLLITADTLGGYILTMAVAFGVAFAASWIMGIKEDAPDEAVSDETTSACSETNETSTEQFPEPSDNEILSPLSGKVIALEDVPDPTFAEGVLGLGTAVEPSEGKVVVPADGTVGTIFDTHHAIGLNLDSGAELLIHIGINTVELHGEGFTAHVSEGDRVKKGQTLITFDKAFIASKGYRTVTPVIIANSDDFKAVTRKADGDVTPNDVLLELTRE